MSLATTAAAPVTAVRDRAADDRAAARLREAAARIATSLARFAATHSRRSTLSESPVLVEDVVAGDEAHRVRGELFTVAAATPVVLLRIERHPTGRPSPDQLREAYGLTPVESRVAALLAERMSNREVAQILGVTEHTARRHTERVLRKLGVNRRTAVRRKLLRCLEDRQGIARLAVSPAAAPSADRSVSRPHPERESGAAQVVEQEGAATARWLITRPRARRVRKRSVRCGRSRERIIVFLARERERQAVRDALGDEAIVQFAAELKELQPPWVGAAPIAVLVELENAAERRLERALRSLQRAAPGVPVWGYAPLDRSSMRQAVRLALQGLIADVIITVDDLETRTRALLGEAREWSEGEALWRVWEPWLVPDTREIVAECIEASARNASTRHLARRLHTSTRTLSRMLTRLGLPNAQRMLALCRLLRVMYRLDQRGASVKSIASELGYPSVAALRMQLTYNAGLHFSRLSPDGRFAALAEVLQAELRELRGKPGEGRGRDS